MNAKKPDGGWRSYPHDPAHAGHTVVGNVWILDRFYSPQLDNHRALLVYVPPSYETGDARYPVLYMHDGQNLFDERTSFAEEWRMDNTMDDLSRQGVEALVVGIPNMRDRRLDEYSPFADARRGGGRGDRYLDFLVDTVKPRIDRDFRTRPDRDHTAVAGSSMGGLISLYAFFRRPEVFGRAAAMSPSLWFANRAFFPFVHQAPRPSGRLYLDVGTLEGTHTLTDTRRLRDALLAKGYRSPDDLMYVEQEGDGHTETAWRERVQHMVPFLLHGTAAPVLRDA